MPTSDHEHLAPDVFGLIWVFDGVNALVSLCHRIDDQVALVAVDPGPAAEHNAAPHQNHFPQPRGGGVPERDLQLEGGQRDVKILPVEQGDGLVCRWSLEGTERVCKHPRPGKTQSIIDEYRNYIRSGGARGLTSHRGRKSCRGRRRHSRVKTTRTRVNGSIVVNVPVAMNRRTIALPVAILADSVVSGTKRRTHLLIKRQYYLVRANISSFNCNYCDLNP